MFAGVVECTLQDVTIGLPVEVAVVGVPDNVTVLLLQARLIICPLLYIIFILDT